MESADTFKRTIQAYLEQQANSDTLFAPMYQKENKNIDDCITYILNVVSKSGCNGFADEEIYSMAVHYYDEDIIDIGNPIDTKVVVNHAVVLTQQEKQQARDDARKQLQQEICNSAKPKTPSKSKIKLTDTAQQSISF